MRFFHLYTDKKIFIRLKNFFLILFVLLSIIGTVFSIYPVNAVINYSNTSSSSISNNTVKLDNHNGGFNGNNSIINNNSIKKNEEKLLDNTSIINFTNTTSNSLYQGTGTSIVMDNQKNIYVIGSISSAFYFNKMLITKFLPNGTLLWNKTSIENYTEIFNQNAFVDSNNNIYVLASVASLSLLNNSIVMDQLILMKYNPDGILIWNKTFLVHSSSSSIPTGNVYYFDSSITLDNNSNIYLVFMYEYYYNYNFVNNLTIIKLTNIGNLIWNRSIITNLSGYIPTSISVVNFNNSLFSLDKLYLLKMNASTGEIEWNSTNITGITLAVDNSGNIYVSNNTMIQKWNINRSLIWVSKIQNTKKIIINNNSLYTISNSSFYNCSLTKINALNGSTIWEKVIYSNSTPILLMDFTIDNTSSIYMLITGGYNISTFLNRTAPYFQVVKWNRLGDEVYLINFGQKDPYDIESKTIRDIFGNIYTLGYEIDPNFYPNWLITLSKRDENGTLLWDRVIGSSNTYTYSFSTINAEIQIDSQNNLYTLIPDVQNFLLTKWNSSNGFSLWNYSYYNSMSNGSSINYSFAIEIESNHLYSFQLDSKGNIYISDPYGGGNTFELMKINANGNLLWNKSFNFQKNAYIQSYKININFTNIFILYSYTSPANVLFESDLTLLELDSQENVLTNKTTPISGITFISSFSSDNQGYLYVIGNVEYSPNSYNIIELKYNQSGSVLYEKMLNLGTIATASVIDPKGFAFIIINMPINNFVSLQSTFIIVDNQGNIYWSKNFINVFSISITLDQSNKISLYGVIVNPIDPNYKIDLGISPSGFVDLSNVYISRNLLISSKEPFINPISIISPPSGISPPIPVPISNVFDFTVLLDGLILIFLFIFIFITSILIFFTLRRIQHKSNTFFQSHDRIILNISKNISKKDVDLSLIEQILMESYHAPNYETVLRIQHGGFPDYESYNQALETGITTYQEWIKYKKENP